MAIADQLSRLNELRQNLAAALTDKGVAAAETEGLETLIPKVGTIETGGAIRRGTFTFLSATYTFDAGMTWEEWVSSSYNQEHTKPLAISDGYVFDKTLISKMMYPCDRSTFARTVAAMDFVCNLSYLYTASGSIN